MLLTSEVKHEVHRNFGRNGGLKEFKFTPGTAVEFKGEHEEKFAKELLHTYDGIANPQKYKVVNSDKDMEVVKSVSRITDPSNKALTPEEQAPPSSGNLQIPDDLEKVEGEALKQLYKDLAGSDPHPRAKDDRIRKNIRDIQKKMSEGK